MIADDHQLFLEGLQYLLEAYGVDVVGKARTGREAVTKARVLKPDIILMDIMMPELSGIEALKLIKAEMPDTKILMLTTSDDDSDLFEAIKYGASGYLIKDTDGKDLVSKLHQAENGEIPLSPGIAYKILLELNMKYDIQKESMKKSSMPSTHVKLTDRQIEILKIIASGKTYKKVGEILGLKERTVKYHIGRIIDILHLDNKAQVIVYAAENGLIDAGINIDNEINNKAE